jgi:hypothetical protein
VVAGRGTATVRLTGAARWYAFVIAACAAFFVLTIAAMLIYPGGRLGDPQSEGYAFFRNFFSDLGQTHTHSGQPNTLSLALFCCALAAVAAGMAAFFITFTTLFARAARFALTAARLAALAGSASAICFLGVAATPWNIALQAHNAFTSWAFELFLAAVVCDIAAVLGTRDVPRRFAGVFALFALVLASYIALLLLGPRLDTAAGAIIQATGQKVIVYASTVTIFVQALLALRLERTRSG